MKRKMVALLFGALLVLSTAVTAALADGNNPDGSNATGTAGYEGQPGNPAGNPAGTPGDGGSPAPGLLGYEGQPGNQGG
jgi:hypothetical protein